VHWAETVYGLRAGWFAVLSEGKDKGKDLGCHERKQTVKPLVLELKSEVVELYFHLGTTVIKNAKHLWQN